MALVDLNLQLGGIAVLLGITPRFTVLDALRHGDRLDGEFVSTLMSQHASGLSVLASSDEYVPSVPIENGTLGKVFHILRERYPYVVVDAGPGLGAGTEEMFEAADCTYVVTQLDIPSLRNAQRFLAHHRRAGQDGHGSGAEPVRAAQTGVRRRQDIKGARDSPRWKIPNDYPGVRRSQNTGTPLALANSPVARGIAEMARAVCGKPAVAGEEGQGGISGLGLVSGER